MELYSSVTLGSDPFLNSSGFHEKLHEEPYPSKGDDTNESIGVDEWLNSNVTRLEGKNHSDDLSVNTPEDRNSPLTRRTDALLNTISFHLVKPKFSE